jgi:hypothetical protein
MLYKADPGSARQGREVRTEESLEENLWVRSDLQQPAEMGRSADRFGNRNGQALSAGSFWKLRLQYSKHTSHPGLGSKCHAPAKEAGAPSRNGKP